MLTFTTKGQSIGIEKEIIPTAKKVEVRSFNDCYPKRDFTQFKY